MDFGGGVAVFFGEDGHDEVWGDDLVFAERSVITGVLVLIVFCGTEIVRHG